MPDIQGEERLVESTDVYKRLDTVFKDVFDDEDIVVRPELSAADVEEWDSLRHIRLILSVEQTFHVRFSAAEVSNLNNVGELAALIQSKL